MSANSSAMTDTSKAPLADSSASGLGNSDRIQLRFGNYEIDILENGPAIRVSNLYSVEDGIRTNRTFAVVEYPCLIEPEFSTEHEAIISGQSIGVVFKNSGWLSTKQHQYFGELEATSDNPDIFSVFGDIDASQLAIHVYSLLVKKNGHEFQYALITEVHHPEYLNLEDLQAIYKSEFDTKREKTEAVGHILKIVKAKMQNA